METKVLTPLTSLPETHNEPTRHLRPVPPQPEGHQSKRHGLRARIAKATGYLLRAGHAPQRRQAPQQANEATPVRPHPAAVWQPEIRRPETALRLQYQGGQKEALQPKGDAIAISTHLPMLAREQVKEQLGFDMGALQAVLHLPGAENPLYCFTKIHQDERGDPQPSYAFATPQQLDQIRSMRATGQPSWDQIREGMLFMDREVDEAGNRPRNRQTIGTARWLPGRATNTRMPKPTNVPSEYNYLAPRQTSMRIDEFGVLMVHDQQVLNPTVVEVSPHLIPAQDPYYHAPIAAENIYAPQ